MITYTKTQMEKFPKDVTLIACVEVNDENMEHVFCRADIDLDDLKVMIRMLRRSLRNTKSQAKYWSEEHQKLKKELDGVKFKREIDDVFNKMIEEADE